MNIMLDVDGTYADFVGGFYKLANKFNPTVELLSTSDQKDWHVWEGVSTKLASKCWQHIERSASFWYELDPLVDGEDRLATTDAHNKYNIYYVTSRVGSGAKYQTEQWFFAYLNVNATVLVVHGKDKAKVAGALNIDWSLEDNGPNAAAIGAAINYHNQSILIDRLYNRQYSQQPRVKSVADFFYRIKQEANKK